jgi:hypothetical protein
MTVSVSLHLLIRLWSSETTQTIHQQLNLMFNNEHIIGVLYIQQQ